MSTDDDPRGTLLLVSLGPIQDFIASARRCQDLWFGSWLLSDLARATARCIGEHAEVVVFPAGLSASDDAQDRPGVANLILARLGADVSARDVAEAAREALYERLDQIADVAFAELEDDRYFRPEVARAQLAELIDVVWVSTPHDPSYAEARNRLYGRLAAIKNTHSWSQPSWTEAAGVGVPKSSLDGARESVLGDELYDRESTEPRRRRYGVKGSERLCGIGLLKRLGAELPEDRQEPVFRRGRPPFHSTSHVAMLPLLSRIARHPNGQRAVERYIDALQKLGLDTNRFRIRAHDGIPTLDGHDGDLLLDSRMRDHFDEACRELAELGERDRRERVEQARSALRSLLRAVDLRGEPCPYYAFVLADGDRMGKAINGIPTLEGHQAFGMALNKFAMGCRDIVTRHQGTLIFSGGDDVLALLPLHTAVACARELAGDFARQVQPVADAHWRPTPGESDAQAPQTTLSVGIGVSHSREPMSDARELAKRAEKLAKQERASLAVIVARRSGADRAAVGRWDEAGADGAIDARLAGWGVLLDVGELPRGAAHDLEVIAAHYEHLPAREQAERVDEIRSLVRQVLSGKRVRGGGASATEATERLIRFIEASADGASAADRVRGLSAELQIASLLQSARDDAHVPIESVEGGSR